MEKVENGIFHTGEFYFGSLLIHKTHGKEDDVIICSEKVFFFFLIISKLRHAIRRHANVSSFSEHLCNHTLEVKIVLAWKFIPYLKSSMLSTHKKMRVYLFFVASLSCHCGSLKMYKKSLLKESFTLKLTLCHFLIRSKTILLISHNLFWSHFPAMIHFNQFIKKIWCKTITCSWIRVRHHYSSH